MVLTAIQGWILQTGGGANSELLIILVSLGWIVLAFLTAADAARRDNSQVLWLFVTLLTGIFGVLAYLLLRGPRTDIEPQSVK